MAATITSAAEGLRERLATIVGLRVYDHIPDTISVPMAAVGIDEVTFHRSFAGGDPVYRFVITVLVARSEERTAQRKLEDFLSYGGQKSIREAIETDMSLGDRVQTCVVERGGNIQPISINDASYLAVDFTVTVHA